MTEPVNWPVLVIDDESCLLDFYSVFLGDEGFEVIAAENGEKGLEAFKDKKPPLVITDLRMPGMDGLEILKRIKHESPETEVIVATGYGDMNVAVQALQLDASDFVSKPIDRGSLMVALKRAIDRYTSRLELKEYTRLLEREKAATAAELSATLSYRKNLIDSSMDGIMALDADGRVRTVNRSLLMMLGHDAGDSFEGEEVKRFFTAPELNKLNQDLLSDRYGGPGRLFMYDTNLLDVEGRFLPVQVSASAIFDQNNNRTGLVCYFRDLREIRRLENEVASRSSIGEDDKIQAMGRLAEGVTDEIHRPLGNVLKSVGMILRALEAGPLNEVNQERLKQFLRLVETEITQCVETVSELAALTNKLPLKFNNVNMRELIGQCSVYAKTKVESLNIRLEVDCMDDLPEIMGDSGQIQKVVHNLIENALEAMPGGGLLKMRAYYDRAFARMVIEIADTGVGIAQDIRPNIFEPFFTSNKNGIHAGLGAFDGLGYHGTARRRSAGG